MKVEQPYRDPKIGNLLVSEWAGNVIRELDEKFDKENVEIIAEWVHYLSTQD